MKLNNIQISILFAVIAFASLPLTLSRVPQLADPQSPPEPDGQGQTEPEPEAAADGPSMADPKTDPGLKDICKVAAEPDLCITSYYVYTGEDHPDKSMTPKAVLRKNLEVAKKMSLEFYTQSISVSSENYGKNNRVYNIFGNCARMFVLGSNSLINAKTALIKKNDIEKTKNEINVAVGHYKECDNSFGDLAEVPKLEAEKLYKLADVCTALANNIHN